MEHETEVESKGESIAKVVLDVRASLNAPLSKIKVGLEMAYLGLLRRGIAAFDHSCRKCSKRE